MTDRTFVDTNVLVYALDDDEPAKRRRAETVLGDLGGRFVVSAQVLSEYYVIVTRKLSMRVEPNAAARLVAELATQDIVPIDASLVRSAIETSQRSQISYWDALIVEAAATAGCERIVTEDLAHGAVIRGVQIVNPFVDQTR
jgi:predicted nucleic acid-binding protein